MFRHCKLCESENFNFYKYIRRRNSLDGFPYPLCSVVVLRNSEKYNRINARKQLNEGSQRQQAQLNEFQLQLCHIEQYALFFNANELCRFCFCFILKTFLGMNFFHKRSGFLAAQPSFKWWTTAGVEKEKYIGSGIPVITKVQVH